MKRYAVGVDLGGTKIQTVLLDDRNELVADYRLPTEAQEGPDAVIERIFQTVEGAMEQAGVGLTAIRGIGIGSPGPLNVKTGVVLCPPNLTGWVDIPLQKRVEERFQVPAALDNDANVAGLAEWKLGAGRGTQNMIYLTISTGIGGAAIVDGKLQHGATGSATEFGHVIIHPEGPLCGCGNHGCLEAFASGTAIAKAANVAAPRPGGESPWTTAEVFHRALLGDAVAVQVKNNAIYHLAIGVANYIHIYNPERVVLGGGVTETGESLFGPLREQVNRMIFPHLRDAVSIVPVQLTKFTGAIGAALLVAE